jgi:hypothetical protein
MSKKLEPTILSPSIASSEASPAKGRVQRAKGKGSRTKGRASGLSTPESFASWSPDGWLSRTSRDSPTEASTKYSGRWARSGILLHGTASARRRSVPPTSETDSLSSHGKRWPTPISRDWKSGIVSDETFNKNSRPLCEHVMRWPTPNALDGKKAPKWYGRGNPSLPCKVEMVAGSRTSDGTKIRGSGSLNPTWVAWLMGFTTAWLC